MKKKLILIICLVVFCCVSIVWAANVKWTALSELTTPAGGDILCIVDDPAGTPVSKKITRDNLIGNWTGSANITTLGTVGTGTWQATAIADGYVPNNITIDLASLATTLTITDNESTAENNPIVFVEAGDLDGGNLGLESDGTCYYTPSTGTITTTQFVGGGAGVTSVDAITGDSATAFFDAGTIEHEYGGLEADINAYTGLVAITGGATAEVDSKSELEGHIADVADFAEADGDIYTGVHDFGGATSLEIPNAADPDVDAVGEITQDANGAGEANDVSLRGFDGVNQFLWARKLKTIQCTIIKPNDLADATRDACPIWSNETGMTFTVWKIEAWSDTDDTVLNVEEEDADGANNASVDELTISTDGTGMYYTTETTITGATIEANHILLLDFDDTDDPGWVKISICGWFNADVN